MQPATQPSRGKDWVKLNVALRYIESNWESGTVVRYWQYGWRSLKLDGGVKGVHWGPAGWEEGRRPLLSAC
jgi:hypothetical protein